MVLFVVTGEVLGGGLAPSDPASSSGTAGQEEG